MIRLTVVQVIVLFYYKYHIVYVCASFIVYILEVLDGCCIDNDR
nr:MAG TPA: hypothetical protein [Caudoviricetes sp.]